MCAQCMTTAAMAVGAAGGLRAWLAARRPGWLTDTRMKRTTAALMAIAVVAAGLGSG